MPFLVPLRALDRRPEQPGVPPEANDEDDVSEDEVRVIICDACEHTITTEAARIAKDGRHDHVFTNPHGYTFHIACFGSAPGVVEVGPASSEWAWFAGHVWQTVVCGGCTTHLGWRFAREGAFYGLILSRIRG